MVSVTVDPNMKSLQQEKETYDKEKTFNQPAETTEHTEETTSTSRPPGEPGVVPNTGAGANQPLSVGGSASGGAAVAAGGGEGSTSSVTENKQKNQIFPSVVREWIRSPAGASAVVGASVSIPRSHL